MLIKQIVNIHKNGKEETRTLSCPQNLLMLQSNFLLVMEDGS
jgi:hypothetical protein